MQNFIANAIPVIRNVGANVGMSFLSNLFGSGGGSNASAHLDREDTQWMYNLQSDQWRANTEWYNQNGYNMLRQGLEKAGYNPLMALGATPLNGATVQGSAVTSAEKSFNFDMKQALGYTEALIRNTNADTALKGAQAEENMSRSNLEIAQKIAVDKNLPYDLRLKGMQVVGAELNNQLVGSQVRVNNAQEAFINQQANESKSRQRLYDSQVKQVHHEIEILKNNKIISDRQAKWYHDHPTQASWSFGLGQWTGAFGNIFGGNAGISKQIK